jgi:hypothetical protein
MTDIIADSDHPVFDHLSLNWREELQWLHDRAEHVGLTSTELEETCLGVLQDAAFDIVASERQGTAYEFGDFQADVYRTRDELTQQMSRFLHGDLRDKLLSMLLILADASSIANRLNDRAVQLGKDCGCFSCPPEPDAGQSSTCRSTASRPRLPCARSVTASCAVTRSC